MYICIILLIRKRDFLKVWFVKYLLDVYLQASKYVKQPLYHVANNLIILYNQEFSEDILLLANEMEFDRNQRQILLREKTFQRKFQFIHTIKNLYRINFLGTGSTIINDLQ
jgi:hypothetical protein